MQGISKKPYFAYRSFRKEFDTMKKFAKIGVKQFCVFPGHSSNSLGEPYSQYAPVWRWFNTYDFAPFDEQMSDIFNICEDAQILCLIDLNSPSWLAHQLHIDSYSQLSEAICDERWLLATENYLAAFVDYAESRYPGRILCYILMCGETDEWMDCSNGTETEPKRKRFQEWCAARNIPVPLDAPTCRQRDEAPRANRVFRNPKSDAVALNYWKWHSDLVADTIIRFSSLVRERVDADREIGVFYGYILELGAAAVQRGHLAYEKLESSSTIDFIISPGDYKDRAMGGGSGFMAPNGTTHLHRKGTLYEIDHRTHSANMKLTPYVELKCDHRWKNLDEDRAGLRREFCRALFHGASLWWFDMWGKFYDDPENIEVISSCRRIWEQYADFSFEPDAEVALIVDPESAFLIHRGCDCSDLLRPVQNALNRLGTPHRIYSMNDIPNLNPIPRFMIFAGAVEISPVKYAMLEKHVFNRIPCFWYGPSGLTDGNRWRRQPLPGVNFPDFKAITPEIIRHQAELAGVHFYTDAFCPVWAGRSLLAVHSGKGGMLSIRLKEEAGRVTELFSGKNVAESCSGFISEFIGPETKLFLMEPSLLQFDKN